MNDYKISEKAYAKMIFHAAKYPHLAVNGVLLAEKSKGPTMHIVDAIPLFHQCLYVTPLAEIALIQIDALAESENLILAGYYAAAENFYDCSVEKAPGAKIADKIHENYKNACFILIDNRFVSLQHERAAIKVFACSGEAGRWTRTTFTLNNSGNTLDAVGAMLKHGAMKDLVDFDNHLDNPENDWRNQFLDNDLQKIVALY